MRLKRCLTLLAGCALAAAALTPANSSRGEADADMKAINAIVREVIVQQ